MKYSFHITFADGSNPYYHFPCEYSKHYRALRKWANTYKLQKEKTVKTDDCKTAYYTAYER